MKLTSLVQISCLAAALAACADSGEPGAPTGTAESEAIGVCGANADPTTGVVCTYQLDWPLDKSYSRNEVFEKDGFDYVRCIWSVACTASDTAKSPDGASCLSVIGTGCRGHSETLPLIKELKIPPGTTVDKLDDLCKGQWFDARAISDACQSIVEPVEQYEDLCCLPRVAPTPTPTTSGGSL